MLTLKPKMLLYTTLVIGTLISGPLTLLCPTLAVAATPPLAGVTVEVVGAVRKPGVYQLPAQSRIFSAIRRAGGVRRDADFLHIVEHIKLSGMLQDGEKVYIPFNSSTIAGRAQSTQVASSVASEKQSTSNTGATLTSLNTATKKEILNLPGIGDARANTLIEHRPFATWDDVAAKTGFSLTLITKLQETAMLD
jgi:competence protein ComEA